MRLISTIALVFTIGVLSSRVAMAQDLGSLMKAVDQLEDNLRQLVRDEAAERTTQIGRLEKQLKTQQHTGASEDIAAVLAQLRTDVSTLKEQLQTLSVSGRPTLSQIQLTEMLNDLESLKMENQYLRGRIDGEPPSLAGTDMVYVPSIGQSHNIEMAEVDGTGSPEISGFFDVQSSFQNSNDDKTDATLGQAEIDLAGELADNLAVEVAVAYNSDDGIFELGAAIIDIRLFGSEGETPGFAVNHAGVVVGQFDVPFGIDYNVYPSPDRKLVTAPRVVDLTHGGWNDGGVQLALETTHGNLVAYWVNGFEASAEVLDEVQTLVTGVDVYEEVNTSPANAFGTRLGIAPIGSLEFGASLSFGLNQSGKSEMLLIGGDLQYSFFNFDVKGEYIVHSLNRSVAQEDNRGYYVQSTYNFDRVFLTSRYGSFKPDGEDWVGQYSFGAGYAIAESLELRLESLINEDSDENINLLQLVACF